jgi:hypothetical protein
VKPNLYSRYTKGESIYGLATNFHVSNTHLNWKDTNQDLFGLSHIRLHPLLPNRLKRLAQLFNVDPDTLLTHSTAFPLYAMSLGLEAGKLRETMMSDDGQLMPFASRQSNYGLPFNKEIKYCPLCVQSSLKQDGKMIWWNVHQFYGVSHCHLHSKPLFFINTGENGINRRYVLPVKGTKLSVDDQGQMLFLSRYIVDLYYYLCSEKLTNNLSDYYRAWLDIKGYLTNAGNIRSKKLSADLHGYWYPIFSLNDSQLPYELSSFHYMPKLVHSNNPAHYLKHVMLMAFLTNDPKAFFTKKLIVASEENKAQCKNIIINEKNVIDLIESGLSMRQASVLTGYSVGAIKQISLRNGIEIGRRRQRITDDMDRDIWRKAFVGMHRRDIADFHQISVSAVEQIIQSHKYLSKWRRHLLFQNKLSFHRLTLTQFVELNPNFSRNKVKNICGSYMWLFKHDKEWLYSNLSKAQSSTYHPSVDWTARDKLLAMKVKLMLAPCKSISALDRKLGGHNWLIKYPHKLPITMIEAQKKVTVQGDGNDEPK